MSLGRRVAWTRVCLLLAAPAIAVPLLAWSPPQGVIPSQQGEIQVKPEPPANGAISGTIIDGTTSEPVVNAIVSLQPGIISKPLVDVVTRQITDERGRFAFVNLPGEGQFTISVAKYGYLGGGYGRERAPSDPLRPVTMRQDEWVAGLRVTLWKPGAISGVVRDESGEPVVGVYVRALKRVRIQGRDDLLAGPLAVTDDRGAYRLPGLSPGRFFVQVPSVQASLPAGTKLPPNGNSLPDAVDLDDTNRLVVGKYPLPPPPVDGRPMGYPLVFYPSTSVLVQSTPIDLNYGDDRSSIDLTLTPSASIRVTGIVEGPAEALQSLTVRLLPAGLENLGLGAEAATALVAADGRFMFFNVPAGSYTLDAPVTISELSTQDLANSFRRAFPAPPPAMGRGMNSNAIELLPGVEFVTTSFRGGAIGPYSGRMPLVVGGSDVNGVVLRLRPHATMSGRIIVEADPAQPDKKPPARFPLTLDPATGEARLGAPQSSFDNPVTEFSITGMVPGQYWLRTLGYPEWVLKSVVWKGRDYTSMPFDAAETNDFSDVVVTVTNMTAQLSGTVLGSEGLKPDDTIVVMFPADPAQWRNVGLWPKRMKTTPVSSNGAYKVVNLQAGDYFVAAIDRSHIADWREPAMLEQLTRTAARLTLAWGAKSAQDLTAIMVR